MPKRTYDEALTEAELIERSLEDESKVPKSDPGVKKNSLDSDEEDECEENKNKYNILEEDDIEGQEEGSAVQEGGVRITPFNMREELEEGHFDTEGNYHWKTDKEIRDNWLDNIEWVNIKNPKTGQEGDDPTPTDMEEEEEELAPETPFDQVSNYRKMLDFMKPKESVAKALQRLGGSGSLSASERLRRKKAGLDLGAPNNQQAVTDLTEIANNILSNTGNMDIYQETYEYIQERIQELNSKGVDRSKTDTVKAVEAELDMYADDFDEKAREQKARKEEEAAAVETKSEKKEDGGYTKEPEVAWQFKWKKDVEEIHGPHTSQQMQAWLDEGYFKGNEWVRKVRKDDEGEFYSIKRVDFEIYM